MTDLPLQARAEQVARELVKEYLVIVGLSGGAGDFFCRKPDEMEARITQALIAFGQEQRAAERADWAAVAGEWMDATIAYNAILDAAGIGYTSEDYNQAAKRGQDAKAALMRLVSRHRTDPSAPVSDAEARNGGRMEASGTVRFKDTEGLAEMRRGGEGGNDSRVARDHAGSRISVARKDAGMG